jgi:hypothetical protein
MKLILALVLGFQCAFSFAAQDCDYHLSLNNATIQVDDVSQAILQNMTITRGPFSSEKGCTRYRVFFSKGLANQYQRKAFSLWGSSLNYNLHSNINQSGILKEFGDALTANEYIEGFAYDRRTTYTNRFYVSTPGLATGAVKSGVFADIVQASIYSYDEKRERFEFEENIGFTALFVVSKLIGLSLVDEGGTFDENSTAKVLDFGILTTGAEKGVDLRVISNTTYRVNFSSQNGSALKNASGSLLKYGMKVNGVNVGLGTAGSSVQVASGDETTSAGDRFNIKFTILDSTTNASSGLYQDQITITATAN